MWWQQSQIKKLIRDWKVQMSSASESWNLCKSFSVVVKPLAALTVGEESMTRSTLRGTLERGLGRERGLRTHGVSREIIWQIISAEFYLFKKIAMLNSWKNEISASEWFTFAVGIWTAIGGVANSPGAEGCMAGGCIGLNAPWQNDHKYTLNDVNVWCLQISVSAGQLSYCISKAWLLVGVFQLFLEGDPCSRNVTCGRLNTFLKIKV